MSHELDVYKDGVFAKWNVVELFFSAQSKIFVFVTFVFRKSLYNLYYLLLIYRSFTTLSVFILYCKFCFYLSFVWS
jgi:hypothetical protein